MATAPLDSIVNPVLKRLYIAEVVGNAQVCREHFWLTLLLPDFAPSTPGQFVQLQSGELPSSEAAVWDWSPGTTIGETRLLDDGALLNRPFSIAAREDDSRGTTLTIIYRTVGAATRWLATRELKSKLTVIGPVGNRFTRLPDRSTAVLVGGGVGIPPMLYCAQQFRDVNRIAFCGVMSRDLLPMTLLSEPDGKGLAPSHSLAPFAAADTPAIVTSDDGSIGRRGFVTDALRDWLNSHREIAATIYACGPEPMLKAVAQLTREFNVPCQVAVERAMACGLGTCQSCVIRVREGEGWKYKLSCTDGPVFDASTLLW